MEQARVLVVEDEIIVARTIANQLTQLGYNVVDIAASGVAALDKASRGRPNLVLMDIVLKGDMDGVTTANQIREQLDIPVVFLTAYADESTLQRAKVTQPFGYIVKPFNSGELRVAVELALYKHGLERDLRDNREYLATLLRSMSDAVIATDDQGQVTFMNPAAETLTGWSQTEAAGVAVNQVFQLVDEVTDLPVDNPVSQVLQANQVVYLPDFVALISKNGDYIPIGDCASPLRRASGEVNGVVVVFWDISDRRQTEVLQKALEKERELNRLKSQFVSTVSHEFRNPLAIIRTATELLDIQGLAMPEAKMKSYLQRIKAAVQSMNQLMEEVLFMGRVEADRLLLRPATLDLEQFCRELIEECLVARSSVREIVFTSQAQATEAVMDENLLRHILTNLLNNAIKYSPTDSPIYFRLTVTTEAQVVFQVQDQGIGIPGVDQAQLYESFYRASNAGNVQGTGLGLAIVKKCVDLHQGQIQVDSEVGVRTTFTVTLPLRLTSP
uniref:hybrid sensor histidine kinase/response regulator n=1 Tax=Trichocoleus desertorum TaxID=1481672 RepID=UPI0025B508C1|nr:hybrid sensor histidine kinase/response regulator [Trichocoleus desertorum]